MALPTRYKTIAFMAGLDGKTDDKAVQGKLLTCKNLVFYQIQSTEILNASKENLFAVHDMKHYADSAWRYDEYSGPQLAKSVSTSASLIQERNVCPYSPVEVTKESVSSGNEYNEPNMGASATYFAWAWHAQDGAATVNHDVLLSVKERATGRFILRNHSIFSATGITKFEPKVYIVGDDIVYVVFADVTATDIHIVKYIISTGVESSTNIISDLHADQLFDSCLSVFSAAVSIAIAYKESASGYLKVVQVSQAPAIVDTSSNTTVAVEAISIHTRGTDLDICWLDATNIQLGTTAREPLVTPVSVNVLGKGAATINKLAGIENPEDVADTRSRAGPPPTRTDTSVVLIDRTIGTTQYVDYYAVSPSPYETVAEYSWNTCRLVVAPFVQNGKVYFGISHESDTDGSYNIMHLGMSADTTLSGSRRTTNVTASLLYAYTSGAIDSIFKPVSISDTTWVALEGKTSDVGINEISSAQLSFSSVTNQIHDVSGASVILGGKPYVASVDAAVEIGFCSRPTITSLQGIATGGSMSDGTYYVKLVYEYIDNSGNIHRSSPSAAVSITLVAGGSAQKIRVQRKKLQIGSSEKLKRTNIVAYRTIASGTTYYYALSMPNQGGGSLDMIMDDSDLQEQVQLYTASGLLLDNTPPPPSNVGLKTYDRLHLVDSFNPQTIWHSKPISAGIAPEFNDALTTTISAGGDIVGLVDMRGSVIVIKDDSIFVFSGEGPGEDGRGTYTPPQLVSNRGCKSTESILQTDFGIYYQTANGVYLIATDLSIQYVGGQVEDYNSDTVINAVHMQDQNQARFMLDDASNTVLVHDYQMNQWAVFTDSRFAWGTGQCANWNDQHIMCNSLATCQLEDTSNVTGEPFELTTEWVQMADWDGFQSVREVHAIGTYKGVHSLSMTGYRDYNDSDTEDKYWQVLSDPGTYTLRTKPKYKKCRAMKYKLTDGAASRSIIDISGMPTTRITSVTDIGAATVFPFDTEYEIISDVTNSSHYIEGSSTPTSATYYSVSVIAKKGDKDWLRISVGTAASYYDLDSVALGTLSGADADAAYIYDLGSNYIWCVLVFLSTGISYTPYIFPADADNDFVYAGDAVTVNTSVSRLYWEQARFPAAIGDSVELNGLRIGYAARKPLSKSRSSST
jgi:hypothetical protein